MLVTREEEEEEEERRRSRMRTEEQDNDRGGGGGEEEKDVEVHVRMCMWTYSYLFEVPKGRLHLCLMLQHSQCQPLHTHKLGQGGLVAISKSLIVLQCSEQ